MAESETDPSKYSVAFKLALQIAGEESSTAEAKGKRASDPREYWLTLYRQCLFVNNGSNSMAEILAMQKN
jgi:hypothetical protein